MQIFLMQIFNFLIVNYNKDVDEFDDLCRIRALDTCDSQREGILYRLRHDWHSSGHFHVPEYRRTSQQTHLRHDLPLEGN